MSWFMWVAVVAAAGLIGLVLWGLSRQVSRLGRKLDAHEEALRLSNREGNTGPRRYLRIVPVVVGVAAAAGMWLRHHLAAAHPVAATAKVAGAAGVTAVVLTGPCQDPAIPAVPAETVRVPTTTTAGAPPVITSPGPPSRTPTSSRRPAPARSRPSGAPPIAAASAPTMSPLVGVAVTVALPVPMVDSGGRAGAEGEAPLLLLPLLTILLNP